MMEEEIQSILEKHVIVQTPPSREQGFLSIIVLVPKNNFPQASACSKAGHRPELLQADNAFHRGTRGTAGNYWLDHLTVWNGKSFLTEKVSVVIESDTSTGGLGATCEGVCTGARPLVSKGETVAHQLPGGTSSLPCTKMFC